MAVREGPVQKVPSGEGLGADEEGEKHRDGHGHGRLEQGELQPVETRFELVETRVRPGIDLVESLVDPLESLIHLLELRIDPLEAGIHALAEVVKPLVGPGLSHRLHDGTMISDKNPHYWGQL